MNLDAITPYDRQTNVPMLNSVHPTRASHEIPLSFSRFEMLSPANPPEAQMKRGHQPSFVLAFVFALAMLAAPIARAQQSASSAAPAPYFTVVPLKGVSADLVHANAAAATSIPLWSYSITSPVNGLNYSGNMVGRSPYFHGARSISVPTYIVPLIIKMPDGGVFDPTATDSTCSPAGTALSLAENSPVLLSAQYPMNGIDVGIGQYDDLFQRANFWSQVSSTGDSYHTKLNVITLPAVVVNVPSGDGTTNSTAPYGGCGKIGVMNFNWFDPYVQSTILPSLTAQGVGPTNLPIFLLYNVVMTDGTPSLTGSCCILGYHAAVYTSALQTYIPVDYDTTGIFLGFGNITGMSHEIGEWMNDPIGTNPTPAWGHTGQVSGCQSNLEVGDPLSGTEFPAVLMPNGVTYTPQELAYFDWFYRISPPTGAGNTYSDNGTFDSTAGAVCQ
jgi:hypothetical protein